MVEKKDIPKEIIDRVLQLVEASKNSGKVKKGVNEATKSIERGSAKLIVIAEDVEPKEIVMHLPILCDEKKIPCVFVPNKIELGRAAGLDVSSAAIALDEVGDGKELLKEILSTLE